MNKSECLQFGIGGPTPCFRQAGGEPCSLDFCPAQRWLERNPGRLPDVALHFFCVMSIFYDEQNEFEEGKGEYARRMGWAE